jgi:hypothetical protein
MTRSIGGGVILSLVLTCTLASAQTSTTTTETKRFDILAVDGNTLVVRLPEGTREITVPDDFRFTVNGQAMALRDLKPGMSGTATITTRTTTTPVTVTEVKNGTVAKVAGNSIYVRTPEGVKLFSQSEINKRGVKIYREGKPAQLSEFREGDALSAVIVTPQPPRIVTEKEVQAALNPSAPPPAPRAAPAAAPAAAPPPTQVARATPSPAAAAQESPRTLPKTAGTIPALGLIGIIALGLGAGLTTRRRLQRSHR